jgi:hypothetical protein
MPVVVQYRDVVNLRDGGDQKIDRRRAAVLAARGERSLSA